MNNSDRHDFLLLLAYQPHPPWLAIPTWNDVLSSSWWNRSMCGSLLMLESHYTDTQFVTMARMGGLVGGQTSPVHGTADGIAENPANRRRERSTRYKRRGVIKPNRIGNHHGLSCKLWLAGPFPSLNSCSQGHASASFYRLIQKNRQH